MKQIYIALILLFLISNYANVKQYQHINNNHQFLRAKSLLKVEHRARVEETSSNYDQKSKEKENKEVFVPAEPESETENTKALTKLLTNYNNHANRCYADNKLFDNEAIQANMFGYRWFLGVFGTLPNQELDNLSFYLDKLILYRSKDNITHTEFKYKMNMDYEVNKNLMFPFISNPGEMHIDNVIDFTSYTVEQLNNLKSFVDSKNLLNVNSQFVTTFFYLLFILVTFMVFNSATISIEKSWTSYTAFHNVFCILIVISYMWANALMGLPKLKSFLLLSSLTSSSRMDQKIKYSTLIWMYMIVIQSINISFIQLPVIALLMGCLNGVFLFKGIEFMISYSDSIEAADNTNVATVLQLFKNSTFMEEYDTQKQQDVIQERTDKINNIIKIYHFSTTLVTIYSVLYYIQYEFKLKKINGRYIMFDFSAINPVTGKITNTVDNIKSALRNSIYANAFNNLSNLVTTNDESLSMTNNETGSEGPSQIPLNSQNSIEQSEVDTLKEENRDLQSRQSKLEKKLKKLMATINK